MLVLVWGKICPSRSCISKALPDNPLQDESERAKSGSTRRFQRPGFQQWIERNDTNTKTFILFNKILGKRQRDHNTRTTASVFGVAVCSIRYRITSTANTIQNSGAEAPDAHPGKAALRSPPMKEITCHRQQIRGAKSVPSMNKKPTRKGGRRIQSGPEAKTKLPNEKRSAAAESCTRRPEIGRRLPGLPVMVEGSKQWIFKGCNNWPLITDDHPDAQRRATIVCKTEEGPPPLKTSKDPQGKATFQVDQPTSGRGDREGSSQDSDRDLDDDADIDSAGQHPATSPDPPELEESPE
ncbi:hypothetical protein DFH27DRAFT_617257 [Peziza echinospora]|nr:hypothetical protein DFH27DRAFT_617257 [Peziza echinospora]